MKLKCPDVRKSATYIQAAIMCALIAAIVSYAGGREHGSHANNNLLNAAHWIMVILLAQSYVECGKDLTEVTWVLYGFLFGELDYENAACTTLLFLSAMLFYTFRHMRKTAARAAHSALEELEEAGHSTGTGTGSGAASVTM